MTYAQLYRQCRRKLTNDTADFDLSQLFHAQFPPSGQMQRSEAEVSAEEAFIFQQKVRRLAEGYPLQYLLGEWEFYSIPLKIGEGVLIPRPDTETLVDAALELLSGIEHPIIADYCAGSGAISLALARFLPDAEVYAVELSAQALPYLYANVDAAAGGERVRIIEADVLDDSSLSALPPLDLLISNPPYLTEQELTEIPEQVRCEPRMALDGGPDGLRFYRAISADAPAHLKRNGLLIFEAGYTQAQQICEILRAAGYREISLRKDLAGIDRCVIARRP